MKPVLTAILVLACSGCASITSVSEGAGDRGLTYYMPKKDIELTITIVNGYPTKIDVAPSSAYPDLNNAFYLNHSGGIVGKNVADVQIVDGLLSSTKATLTSDMNNVVKNLAGVAGIINFRDKTKATTQARVENDCGDGAHKFMVPAANTSLTICKVQVSIEKRAPIAPKKAFGSAVMEPRAGIYYRQNIPYLVKATSLIENNRSVYSAVLALSPSESEIYFLPMSRTFFANNEADFTFDKGIPTKYKQDTDGELLALTKIPADILSAYFAAIGNVFTAFTTRNTQQITGMESTINLELMKAKYEACMAAVQVGDEEKLVALKCGEKL